MNFDVDIDDVLRLVLLPQIRSDRKYAVDAMDAYVSNYLREEVQQEALVRRLDSFARFLQVSALMNGQVANVSGIARDAAVARPTVQGYFDVLTDTLIGYWLPAWRRRAKVKEVASPKFYLFDPGVARALAGRLREPLDGVERGFLLVQNLGGALCDWGTPSGSEVDFVWTRAARAVGIEVKSSTTWRREFGGPLKALVAEGVVREGFGVYTRAAELKDGPLRVLPLKTFSAGVVVRAGCFASALPRGGHTSSFRLVVQPGVPSTRRPARGSPLRDRGTIHAKEATRKGGLRRDRGMDSPGLTSKVEVERANDDA